MAHHRRKGDVDDKSHRGHPLCEFCDRRFMDKDQLFKHLRREHYFCHFCDADGQHLFYRYFTDLSNNSNSAQDVKSGSKINSNPQTFPKNILSSSSYNYNIPVE